MAFTIPVMTVKAFRIAGLYSPKGKKWYKFTKDVVANDEGHAVEIAYSLLGSKYGIKRRLIKVEAIREIKPEESKDPTVKFELRDKDGE